MKRIICLMLIALIISAMPLVVSCDTTSQLTVLNGLETGTQSLLSALVTATFQAISNNLTAATQPAS